MADKKQVQTPWKYRGKEVNSLSDMPDGVLGFIYLIENRITKRRYIGRKTVSSNKKKKLTAKEKLLPENARKTYKYEVTETAGWKNYFGSNTTLKAEVAKGDIVDRTILHYCFTKAEMTYRESAEILCSGILLDVNGYNDWVSCRIYKKHLLAKK